jgi:hypothetical protein
MINTAYMNSNAADCVRMAGEAESAGQRTVLLGLAQAWVALSQQAREIEDDARAAPRGRGARDPEPAW